MAGLTMANADAALKEFYEPGIREQINNDIPWLAQLEKNSRDIVGRRAVLAAHTQRNSGVGARAAGGALPTAGAQGYQDVLIPLKRNYGSVQLDGQTIRAMKTDRGAFVRAVESETKGITNDLKRDVNRQSWGTSDGVIATCGTTTATTVVVLAAATGAVQMRQFEVGMVVDIADTAAPPVPVANGSAVTITAVNSAGLTITVSGAGVTTTSAHRVYRSGAGGGGASQLEITGNQTQLMTTGNTVFGLSAATYPIWNPTVLTAVGSLSENIMAKLMQTIQVIGGEYPDIAVASDGVFRSFANLLTSLKRMSNTVNLKGGYSGLDFTAGGPTIPVVWDRDAPTGTMTMANTGEIQEYQMSDWEFMQEDGAVLSRVPGYDQYAASLFKYHDACCGKRNSAGALTGVTES